MLKFPSKPPLQCTICATFALNLHLSLSMTVKIINNSPFDLPQYATTGSAGLDLKANISAPITLQPLDRFMVPTGLSIELPLGFEAQVRPRSGLAAKRGLTMLNAPGTIDSDYRGEIHCIVVNLSNDVQTIEPGERIAQMVIARYEQITWQQVEVLGETERGIGGFGSTGKN
jgi:dUTP pyrophosphatase